VQKNSRRLAEAAIYLKVGKLRKDFSSRNLHHPYQRQQQERHL
jgi:hypothetical protein